MTALNHSLAALTEVQQRIVAAAQRAGRRSNTVKLVAVSKTHPVTAIQQLVDLGQTVFGESQIQEAMQKTAHFSGQALEWHFIGHLQSNKARLVPGHFGWVHSIDSARTACRISEAAEQLGVCVKLLLQVNVAGDPAKHGVTDSELFPLVETILEQSSTGIQLCGLMTIGRFGVAADETRRDFARLRELLDQCRDRFGSGFRELSMGMSGDYEIAIEEGATLVRVGSALFGARD